MEGPLTTLAGVAHSGRKRRKHQSEAQGERNSAKLRLEEWSVLGPYLRASSEPALKPQEKATLSSDRPTSQPPGCCPA